MRFLLAEEDMKNSRAHLESSVEKAQLLGNAEEERASLLLDRLSNYSRASAIARKKRPGMGRSAMTMDTNSSTNDYVAAEPESNRDPNRSKDHDTDRRPVSFATSTTGALELDHEGDGGKDKDIEELLDSDGRVYFHNRLSGHTAWSREEAIGSNYAAVI